ncbi:hypothetical protein PACID_23770 [Acidipropionibacterium acidipropionici ATCC 4875]|uniref:DUF3618 domain-containing protein n=1 Tax=Acidipropionibacterium acidipropionici (strain ATCC 4875 / DSM 20272 / JCM 6432 / NBRC 12425 / NCIMB 8070 / 4) TaxID=1171373 RepID=K7RQ40_ACIA4|nr:DUF3618 domain-containing protein [Acidipropionibacterium acidipropionici]AFV90154.1 hypothetical protein PACID_23770 [Acidipropionibacterium acidipropionici ATCC 4875]ALN15568.1 hypothetical protein ASQ49_10115 [Acidipropionibacterium acidipropionici]APZ08685.1 hypothetical protein BWX38_04790 [Acidipropionibacterium acidipropionici]MDN6557245.1 DUF3618 domain-containing protein [Acidipropionibacterium acidipropionici]
MAEGRQQKTAKDTRSADQIRRDIAAARARMSSTIEGLTEEFHPVAVKNRAVGQAKDFAQREYTTVRDRLTSQVKDENGWRTDRLTLIGGGLVAAVGALVVLRAVVGRASGATTRRKLEKVQLAAAKQAAKDAKVTRRSDKKLARSNRKHAGRNAERAIKLDDDTTAGGVAQAMLKQAASLRAEAADERNHSAEAAKTKK